MRSSAKSRDATYTLHSESLWHRTQLGLIYDDDVAMLSIFSVNNSAICTQRLHKTHRGQETHHTHCKSSQDTAICSSPGKLSVGRVYVLRLYGYVNILLSWLCPLTINGQHAARFIQIQMQNNANENTKTNKELMLIYIQLPPCNGQQHQQTVSPIIPKLDARHGLSSKTISVLLALPLTRALYVTMGHFQAMPFPVLVGNNRVYCRCGC